MGEYLLSHPRIVAQLEATFVVVVDVPETPKEVVVSHIEPVSVLHPSSGSGGKVGCPSKPI